MAYPASCKPYIHIHIAHLETDLNTRRPRGGEKESAPGRRRDDAKGRVVKPERMGCASLRECVCVLGGGGNVRQSVGSLFLRVIFGLLDGISELIKWLFTKRDI